MKLLQLKDWPHCCSKLVLLPMAWKKEYFYDIIFNCQKKNENKHLFVNHEKKLNIQSDSGSWKNIFMYFWIGFRQDGHFEEFFFSIVRLKQQSSQSEVCPHGISE